MSVKRPLVCSPLHLTQILCRFSKRVFEICFRSCCLLQVSSTGSPKRCNVSGVWSCSTRSRGGSSQNYMCLDIFMKVYSWTHRMFIIVWPMFCLWTKDCQLNCAGPGELQEKYCWKISCLAFCNNIKQKNISCDFHHVGKITETFNQQYRRNE